MLEEICGDGIDAFVYMVNINACFTTSNYEAVYTGIGVHWYVCVSEHPFIFKNDESFSFLCWTHAQWWWFVNVFGVKIESHNTLERYACTDSKTNGGILCSKKSLGCGLELFRSFSHIQIHFNIKKQFEWKMKCIQRWIESEKKLYCILGSIAVLWLICIVGIYIKK